MEAERSEEPVAQATQTTQKARCFKCKENVEVMEAKEETMSNQRRRIFGKCAKCGGQVSQFIKQVKQD